jgi:hypothetical protein
MKEIEKDINGEIHSVKPNKSMNSPQYRFKIMPIEIPARLFFID